MYLYVYVPIYLYMNLFMLSLLNYVFKHLSNDRIMSEQLEGMWQQVIVAHTCMEGLRRNHKTIST
jgi:hypothetical protein